jgi:hypothetical protein
MTTGLGAAIYPLFHVVRALSEIAAAPRLSVKFPAERDQHSAE